MTNSKSMTTTNKGEKKNKAGQIHHLFTSGKEVETGGDKNMILNYDMVRSESTNGVALSLDPS